MPSAWRSSPPACSSSARSARPSPPPSTRPRPRRARPARAPRRPRQRVDLDRGIDDILASASGRHHHLRVGTSIGPTGAIDDRRPRRRPRRARPQRSDHDGAVHHARASVPPLAVSGILGAPNPFDANHGFTLLARHDAELRGGSTVGAVAVGGDLSFGPYNVTPKPAAVLDEMPVGLLVGGGVATKELQPAADRRRQRPGARRRPRRAHDRPGRPRRRGRAGRRRRRRQPPDPHRRAAGRRRGRVAGHLRSAPSTASSPTSPSGPGSLAASPSTAVVTDDAGSPVGDQAGRRPPRAGSPRATGRVVWSVTARDLARASSITIDPAPTAARPAA